MGKGELGAALVRRNLIGYIGSIKNTIQPINPNNKLYERIIDRVAAETRNLKLR